MRWIEKYLAIQSLHFEILECAGHSSQGGKLSFWNCRIRNTDKNIDVSIGVNSEILCMLLQETTFINGVCQGNVILAKYDGQLGVVCKGTESYSEAIQSQHRKDSLKKGKTTKWEKGFEYITQSTSDIWIGDAYRPITVETDYFNKYIYMILEILERSSMSLWKHGVLKATQAKIVMIVLGNIQNL